MNENYQSIINKFFDKLEDERKNLKTEKEFIKHNRLSEAKFYDNVLMKCLEMRLGAALTSKTYRNEHLHIKNPKIGDMVNGRDINLVGVYRGMPYSVSVSRRKTVTGYDIKAGRFLADKHCSETHFWMNIKKADGSREEIFMNVDTNINDILNAEHYPILYKDMNRNRKLYTEQFITNYVDSIADKIYEYLDLMICDYIKSEKCSA